MRFRLLEFMKRIKDRVKEYLNLNQLVDRLIKFNALENKSNKEIIEIIMRFSKLSPSQKTTEIEFLMDLIKENQLTNICEIGSYKGGSLFLFCQAAGINARLISVDIEYPLEKMVLFKKFARNGQEIKCIKANSQELSTVKKIRRALKGREIDLLFIDGDHSFYGVMNDFILYSPLVRIGRFIAFHDIHPDSFLKFGKRTIANVGEVPIFWEAIKKAGYSTFEKIEDPDQDGKGIGVIIKQ